MKRYKAVLFDIDGTLMTLDTVIESLNKAIEENGYEKLSKEKIIEEMIGYPLMKILPEILDITEKEAEKISEDYTSFYISHQEGDNLYPGVREIFKELREKGFKIGLVTTKKREEALASLEKYPEIEYDVLIGGDDVKNQKPDPEPIEKACDMLNINPKEAVYVGDHKVDIKAGLSAGCDTIGLTTGVHGEKDLEEVKTEKVEIKNDIRDILPVVLKEAEEVEKTLKIPKNRIGALIGEKGETKKKIEQETDVKLDIDSKTGETTVKRYIGRSPEKSIRAIDVVKAIGYGFSPRKAFKLLEPKVYIEIINITQHTSDSNKNINRVKSRLIGKKGKTRKTLERLTKTKISIKGKKISIIGKIDQIQLAKRGIKKLIQGTPHRNVYKDLEQKRSQKTW